MSKTKRSHRNRAGFSLVEVAMALAIIGFCCTALMGLLAMGLTTFHQALSNTIESEIVQSLSNDLRLDNFSTLTTYSSTPPTYYYDHDGRQLSSSTGAFYQALIALAPVTNSNSPTALDPAGSTSIAAYNVTVTITNTAQSAYDVKHPHLYSLIIANNGL